MRVLAFLKNIGDVGVGILLPLILISCGVCFTGYLGGFYLLHPVKTMKLAISREGAGKSSPLRALSVSLAGTLGVGNIVGVAVAIVMGGAGALFWMWISAFLSMILKYAEIVLAMRYRSYNGAEPVGGPMYYMKRRLHLSWLAGLFAFATILSSFGTGSLPQINSISNAMFSSFGISHYITGLVLAVILALIIIGGIKRIAQVTEKLTPFMAIVYVLGSLSVLIYNYDQVWPAVVAIFGGVFSGTAATGGFLGATVALAFNRGVNRGLFSNEAGQGSAPIAHAAAKAEDPVSEGMVALLEPFIDTIVICALTGLVLVSSGVWHEKYQNQFQGADLVVLAGDYAESDAADRAEVGAHLLGEKTLPLFSGDLRVERGEIETEGITILHARSFAEAVQVKRDGQPFTGTLRVDQGKVLFPQAGDKAVYMEGRSLLHSAPLSTEAFKRGILGDWGQYVIPVSLLLFAFSTTIAWAYYGSRAITYLWGVRYVRYYQVIYVVAFFLASFTDTTIVWTLSGITVALMTLPNLIGILLLHKEVKACVRDYVRKMKLG